jgi:mono/diheme cytochrome c family protein
MSPDAGMGDGGVMLQGEQIYRSPISAASAFACASCHALDEPAEDGFRRAAHRLGDATKRPSYHNSRFTMLLDAVNVCLVEWMAAEPWAETDARWIELHRFLDARAPDGVAPLVTTQIVTPPAVLTGGDSIRGRALFNGACALCHGIDGAGGQIGPMIVGTGLDAAYVARRVRTSGPARSAVYVGLTGGVMPFWGADRLSDAELLDIIAFVAE